MKAEIITSGTELLLGELSDTHTSFIASQLAILGIDLYFVSIVGDNYDRFLSVLKQARERSDLVIITGGLGPTRGDITREVIAGLLNEKMEVDPGLKEYITGFFARLGMEMPENNLKQACLIPSAKSLPNPLGTAPGWWIEKDGKIIVSLPGPPGEMQPMWRQEIFPRLERLSGAVIVSRTLKTWGISEAKIDQLVGRFMSMANPTLALYAKGDGIHLRITAKSENKAQALILIDNREKELRDILKEAVWGMDSDVLENTVGQILLERGLTLAVAETFTGGQLVNTLSGVKDYHRFLKGGLVVSGELPETSISAVPLAVQAREKFSADIGIAVTGQPIDNPEPGLANIAVDSRDGRYNITATFPGRPAALRKRAVVQALYSLRKTLLSWL